jgi:hypothetical protein
VRDIFTMPGTRDMEVEVFVENPERRAKTQWHEKEKEPLVIEEMVG